MKRPGENTSNVSWSNAVGLTKCKACGARLNLLVAELAFLLYARRIEEQKHKKTCGCYGPINKFRESTQTPKYIIIVAAGAI